MAAEGKLGQKLKSLVPKEVVDDARHWSKSGHAVVAPLKVFAEMQHLLAQWWQPKVGELWQPYLIHCVSKCMLSETACARKEGRPLASFASA